MRRRAIPVLLCAAVVIVAAEVWHGPTLLVLSSGHGIDTGDLLAAPFVVLAIALWRGEARSRRRDAWSRLVPVAVCVLGALLVLAAFDVTAGGGPLVPVGGGTIDGVIQEAFGTTTVPIARWTYVASTYDGATVRLYVNGEQVSSHAASGTVQRSRNPLWIGGNRPYGEHFSGTIDELRVYARALDAGEIRSDMATPVRPARGLVAAYPFDAGSGTTAADASGNGNAGAIAGATWTRGRYGRALEFDGERAIVRVEPSASLDVGRAMTLSGWIRPSTWQSGWRTIVQRQTDAYLLTASSNRHSRFGLLDDIRAALVVAAMIWLGLLIAAGGGGGRTALLRSWWLPLGLFLAGCLIDAAIAPSASLVGPALVAAWLAATASTRVETAGFVIAAAALTALTIAWLGDPAEAGEGLTRADGAIARSVALGALLVVAGAVRLGRRRTRSRSAVRGQRRSP